MPQLRVVFDANIYRTLGAQAFETVRVRERSHSIIGLASYWTCAELLTHMASPSDAHFKACWGAIRRLAAHSSQFDGRRPILRLMADTDDQLARMLFGRNIPGRAQEAEAYGRLIGAIAGAGAPNEWAASQAALDGLSAHVANEEKIFSDASFKHIVQTVVPGATSWDAVKANPAERDKFLAHIAKPETLRLIGGLLVDKTAARLNLTLADTERETRIDSVLKTFAVPIRFYNSIVRRIAMDGYNLTKGKNSNSLWDFQVAFSTSAHLLMDGTPVWLVTNDGPIVTAAKDCGAASFVRTLEEYQIALALGGEEFSDLIRSQIVAPAP
jgi:hypothetical protein